MEFDSARELLLAALSMSADYVHPEAIQHAVPKTWTAVLDLARQHGVAPLLYRRLKDLGLALRVPPDILTSLRDEYLAATARALVLYEKLGRVLTQFHAKSIPVIPLKGIYLAEAVYGHIGLRSMGDVDLMVKTADLTRVEQVLFAMGFQRTHEVRERIREIHHFGYRHPADGLYIEVHWNLVSPDVPIHIDAEDLWSRSRPTTLAKAPVFVLAPEDLLLHLCVHAAGHTFTMGLRGICDLAWTIHRHAADFDWSSLEQRAHTWRADRSVYVALDLAREFLQAPVPDALFRALRPQDAEMSYVTIARQQLFASVESPEQALADGSGLVEFWMEGTLRGKLQRLREHFFPPREAMAIAYPASPHSLQIWLYYPIHAVRLFRRHTRFTWELLRRDRRARSQVERQNEVNALHDWLTGTK